MQRREFIKTIVFGLSGLAATARSEGNILTIGIYPGTGKADIPNYDFMDAAMPFARALGGAMKKEVRLLLFRSIKNVVQSLGKGRLDVYFVPPTVAVSVLDNQYSPVARARDQAMGALVKQSGVPIVTVALTEKESWLDVMSRHEIKRSRANVEIVNFKSQEDVILALKNGMVQAGSLRMNNASELMAAGGYETWLPLPTTPDFTLMVSDRFSQTEQDKLGAVAVNLDQATLQLLQKTIHSKITGFVVDKAADYKTIKAAMAESGYLD